MLKPLYRYEADVLTKLEKQTILATGFSAALMAATKKFGHVLNLQNVGLAEKNGRHNRNRYRRLSPLRATA